MEKKERLVELREKVEKKCDPTEIIDLKKAAKQILGQDPTASDDCIVFRGVLTEKIKNIEGQIKKIAKQEDIQTSLSQAAPDVLSSPEAQARAKCGKATLDGATCATALFPYCRPYLGASRVSSDVPTWASGAAASASGLSWQTALFTGLTDFLLERASQELGLWLLQTMQKQICATSKWFPQACKILNPNDPSGKIVEQVPASLFSSAVRADLESFPIVAVSALAKDNVALEMLGAAESFIVRCAAKKGCGVAELKQFAQTFADKTHLADLCKENDSDPSCKALRVASALDRAAARFKPPFSPKSLCTGLKDTVESDEFKRGLEEAMGGSLSADWNELFKGIACAETGPVLTDKAGKAPKFAAYYTWVMERNALAPPFAMELAPQSSLADKCSSKDPPPGCAGLGVALAIEQARAWLIPPFRAQETCNGLLSLVKQDAFRRAVGEAFKGNLPRGWSELFQESPACGESGPAAQGTDAKAPPRFAALFALVKDGNDLIADLQKKGGRPDPDAIVARAHKDLDLLLDLAWQGALLHGTPDALRVGRDIRIAVGAIDVLAGLYDVFTQLRRGASPLELLAGLATVARRSSLPKQLCTDEDTRNKLGCTAVAVGTLVAETGGVLDMFKPGKDGTVRGWDETVACGKIKEIVEDENFWTALDGLYVTLPEPLAALKKKKNAISCTSWPPADDENEALIQLRRLLRAAYDLESQLRQVVKEPDKSSTREKVAQMLSLMINVVEAAADLVGQEKSPDIVRLLGVCQVLGDMFQGNYADGIRGTIVLLSEDAAALPESVRRYLPLISDLASAKDAKSVQAALQAAAAPLGTWRAKQRRPMISVTSVVGGSAAWEHALGPTNVMLSDGWGAGAMASLGVEFSADWYSLCRAFRGDGCGMSPPTKANGSIGLYATVIDLGQLAVARVSGLTDTSTSMNPPNQQTNVQRQSNVSWEDVFSPGLYLKLNIPRTPLTFGGGAAYAPQLRKYSFTDPSANVTSEFLSTIRVGIFFGVDLTLFPLK
ncbi:MAG: hypothetical protein U1A78_25035 [Polyangia bacterium]